MYKYSITGTERLEQYRELMKIFLPPEELIRVSPEEAEPERRFTFSGDKEKLKRELYRSLEKATGHSPKWGILTGIRPVKLAGELLRKTGDLDQVKEILERDYLLHPSKSGLTAEILQYQRRHPGLPEEGTLSLYVGIPFCPTRCLYCSFTSNQVAEEEIDRYLEALRREIAYAGRAVREKGWRVESLYMGGGTPTTLNENQLDGLLEWIADSFDLTGLTEYTVEAGRPDTITAGKLRSMKAHGVDRISINPQSMKEETLLRIGRAHSREDVLNGFRLAREAGFETINADLIAGLPGEDLTDFQGSVEEIIRLGAENVTLHTLAVKRASRLKELDEGYHYRNQKLREDMLAYAHEALRREGYKPYYLYRQKHTAGNTENIGFCREAKVSVYNIRIMEEAQSILALGAGGISKIYFPAENRLERVPNVSNYEIYIRRIDEMIRRKEENFILEEKKC